MMTRRGEFMPAPSHGPSNRGLVQFSGPPSAAALRFRMLKTVTQPFVRCSAGSSHGGSNTAPRF
jgi:hypothetical protein